MISKTPAPPYYAVIFTSVKTPEEKGYSEMAERMIQLAKTQPGFLGVESAREEIEHWRAQEWDKWDRIASIQKSETSTNDARSIMKSPPETNELKTDNQQSNSQASQEMTEEQMAAKAAAKKKAKRQKAKERAKEKKRLDKLVAEKKERELAFRGRRRLVQRSVGLVARVF